MFLGIPREPIGNQDVFQLVPDRPAGTRNNQDRLNIRGPLVPEFVETAQKAGTRMFSANRGIVGNIRARVARFRDPGTGGNQEFYSRFPIAGPENQSA